MVGNLSRRPQIHSRQRARRPLGAIAADLSELAEERIDVLNWQVDTLKAATISDLLSVFQEQKRMASE